jgi:predicted membrane channel-forming protein YqfA (hemolysin III family)
VQRERFSRVGYYTQLMLANIAIAVVLFSFRIPERFISNMFDFVGNSHHLLHIFSLLAIYCFYLALAEAASTLPLLVL